MTPNTTHKIELGVEIPTEHLDDLVGCVDWYFCIATECLKDARYFQWHVHRPNSVRVMLDNGMYEEGRPMAIDQLLQIVEHIQPEVVFAPDVVGDRKATLALTEEFRRKFVERKISSDVAIGVIPQGSTPNEVVECLIDMMYKGWCEPATPIGLSFLNDRNEVFHEMTARKVWYDSAWYHLLGLYGVDEIANWPRFIRSMDTVKPIKGALYGHKLETTPRGLGKWNTKMIIEDVALMHRNVNYLHTLLTRRL